MPTAVCTDSISALQEKTCGLVYTICSVWDLPQQSVRPNILRCFYRAASTQDGLGMSVNVCPSVCQTRELW